MDKTVLDALLNQLPDITQRTAAQLEELHKEPSEVRAELAALQVEGVARHIRRIGDEMRRAKS